MFDINIHIIDFAVIYQIFAENIWYVTKLLIVSFFWFFYIPTKIFPQKYSGKGIQKVVFNFVYMVAYIEIVVTFLVFIKVFSIFIFIVTLIFTKLAFLKWYYKIDIIEMFELEKTRIMIWIFDTLDNPKAFLDNLKKYLKLKFIRFQKSLKPYVVIRELLFISVFIYIIFMLIERGFYSYADPVPDTAQFIEWVGFLQHNILFPDNKTSADMYGISILIFFINSFSNINVTALFSLYPILLLFALYFSIYFIIKDLSHSKYIALFAVMFHGIVFMSPFSNFFLSQIVTTSNPVLVKFFGLSFYDVAEGVKGHYDGFIPYVRYISGMAYEHASVFVFLNAYFLIKLLKTHLNIYLLLYGLTLMLVFVFHGGGAIILFVISILLAFNAILFRKIDFDILKKGVYVVIIATLSGNLWALSMIKYGIPPEFGAAAPFLDKMLGPTHNFDRVPKLDIEKITIIDVTSFHLVLIGMLIFALVYSFFTKRRFENSSFLLISLGIFIVYFATNIGLPMMTRQDRVAEYLFFALIILFSFYLTHFVYRPLSFILKRWTNIVMLTFSYLFFLVSLFVMPTWIDTNKFWENIINAEYTSIPKFLLKIDRENVPFTWTIVSYVQEYSKVKGIGYHIDTKDFILKYSPLDRYLKIPTPKIFVVVENIPHPYRGMKEWFYRWRPEIENTLKSWIAIYTRNHNNIKIYAKTATITIYEIDNSEYMKLINKKDKK